MWLKLPVLVLACLMTGGQALPFISDFLGDLELSLPSGDEASWKRRDSELRVEDKLRQVLKAMATDVTERQPGGVMEDPLPISSSLEQSAAGATFKLQNIALTGLRTYDVPQVHVDLTTHEYSYELQFPRLDTLGQYVLDYYWTAAEGDFTITMHQVTAKGKGLLDVHGDGTVQLNAGHSHVEVSWERVAVDLGNPGLVDTVAQTAAGVLGPYLFDVIKPSTLHRINHYLAQHGAITLRELDEERMLDGSLAVVDSHVLAARRRIREAGFDPLQLPDMSQAHSGVEVLLTHGVLTGLSSLKRRGDVALGVMDQTAKATLSLGTERVTGKYRWTVRGFNLLERSGFIKFSVDSVQLRARLAQAISLKQRPRIDDIDVDLGRLTFRCEGMGSLDYALNIGSQSFPGMIKSILVNAVEAPLVWIIENQFSELGLV